ncbi:MAG: substrate-binding domain-containing protein [Collinsella sp.]
MSRFFSSFARNLEVRCRERGYALFIMNSDGKTENDADLVRLLINRGVDGIFLVAAEEVSPDPLLMEQLEAGIVPVVMVDRSIENAPGDKVRLDEYRRIPGPNQAPARRGTSPYRVRGDDRLHLTAPRSSGRLPARVLPRPDAPRWRGPGVRERLLHRRRLCRAAGRICGLRCHGDFRVSSDNIAPGVLKRLHAHGKRVPRDYSLVSYDNSAADALFEPALTAIEQDVEELADHALELLLSPGVEAKATARHLGPSQ